MEDVIRRNRLTATGRSTLVRLSLADSSLDLSFSVLSRKNSLVPIVHGFIKLHRTLCMRRPVRASIDTVLSRFFEIEEQVACKNAEGYWATKSL